MAVALGITKNEGESWRDCAMRYAKKWGLEHEIAHAFDACLASGDSDEEAAWAACYEWDVCDLKELEE